MAQGDFTRINTNIGALNALNSLKNINTQMGVRQLRLATGKRINEAAEDPAGLTIATKFKYRASGLGVALDNIGDAKNLIAVAEGGLNKINDILVTMRDKVVQASNDALGDDERTAIQSQLDSFESQITNIVDETKWNGQALLKLTGSLTFQTGADASETTSLVVTSDKDSTSGTPVYASFVVANLGTVNEAGLVGTQTNGSEVIDSIAALKVTKGAGGTETAHNNSTQSLKVVDAAIKQLSKAISDLGSLSARLTFKEETLSVAKVNTEAAHNRIMNADMAYEQLESTKLGILQQTATAMLSQANQGPQSVLSLFR